MPAKRGRHREGYYLALLHVLELAYELQEAADGGPQGWQPVPRNRPDQFVMWARSSLRTLGLPAPKSLRELVRQLEGHDLKRVAQVLVWTVERQLAWDTTQSEASQRERMWQEPLEQLVKDLGRSDGAAEAHPQVRKVSQVMQAQLDEAWCDALEATVLGTGDLSSAAVLLGGVPPGFIRLFDAILGTMLETGTINHREDASVLQCYALITGNLPELPPVWQEALEVLASFEPTVLWRLRGLSTLQHQQLMNLPDEALELVAVMQQLTNKSSSPPEQLVAHVARLSPEALEQVIRGLDVKRTLSGRRVKALPVGLEDEDATQDVLFLQTHWPSSGIDLTKVHALTQIGAWEVVRRLDVELLRLLYRQEITAAVILRLQGLRPEVREAVLHLLEQYWEFASDYLEDMRVVRTWLSGRSPAMLNLREVFPQTIAWLDAFFRRHYEDVVLVLTEDVTEEAQAFTRRVLERLREVRST